VLLLALSDLTDVRTYLLAVNVLIKSKSKIDHIELLGNHYIWNSGDLFIIYCQILIIFNIGTSGSGISHKTKVIFKHILTFFELKTVSGKMFIKFLYHIHYCVMISQV
jgi:hypothetical protein